MQFSRLAIPSALLDAAQRQHFLAAGRAVIHFQEDRLLVLRLQIILERVGVVAELVLEQVQDQVEALVGMYEKLLVLRQLHTLMR